MLSFRVADSDAESAQRWAERLGVDRSALLRDALRMHLVRLAGEHDADAWLLMPATEGERALAEIAEWGPAEDWLDWADAKG
ncbi:MAG: ribbon-helix-helix protein, CopG family [Actinobacteria bacterium]|nr:ribbon-helix-helix protein, CopG family [Actinomycetota bacterium]